jgi:hypothetical protein
MVIIEVIIETLILDRTRADLEVGLRPGTMALRDSSIRIELVVLTLITHPGVPGAKTIKQIVNIENLDRTVHQRDGPPSTMSLVTIVR